MPRNNVKKLSPKKEPVQEAMQASNDLQSILGFVMPTEHVSLPSQGKFYPPEHPLHNCEDIEIKFLTAKELDILTSENLLKKGIAIERMLESIIINKEIKVNDLLVGDKNAIIVAARAGTFGADYEVSLRCGECEKTFTHTFDLNEIGHLEKAGDDDIEISENGTFFVTLPQTEVKVECRFLTSKDEELLEGRASKKKKLNLPESVMTDQFKSFIVSLNGVTERGLVDEFVDVMPAGDLHYLNTQYANNIPNLDMVEECVCTNCNAENRVTLPFTANFFWPDSEIH